MASYLLLYLHLEDCYYLFGVVMLGEQLLNQQLKMGIDSGN